MAMQKMTLGRRVSIGFGILVVITLTLGGMGVYNMRNAATNSEKLSNMYAPEALVASDIARVANQIRFEMRAFAMNDDEVALANVKKGFIELKKYLDEAHALGKKYPELKSLAEKETAASKALVEYMAATERTEKIFVEKKKVDAAMVENAKKFMQNANLYSESLKTSQEEDLQTDKIDKTKMID